MEIKDAIRIIENTAGFDDDTTGVGEAWKTVLCHIDTMENSVKVDVIELWKEALEIITNEQERIAVSKLIGQIVDAVPMNPRDGVMMEPHVDNNYICARRRDAITDPPPEGKPVVVMSCNILQHVLFTRVGNRWECADDGSEWDGCEIEPGDQWLDVTDVPAVPREKVQAAVDEMDRLEDLAAKRNTEFWHGREDGLLSSMIVIHNHTGVTPSEVL